MPKSLLQIKNFNLGIINAVDNLDIPEGGLANATNLMCDVPGKVRTMGQDKQHDDLNNEKQLDGFMCHRHDQSVLNVMFKVKGYKALIASNCYGVGPFFHSRKTDVGYRKFAADWWRAEPDFNIEIHHTWDHYLNSKSDPNWWKNQNDYNNSMLVEEDYLKFKWGEYTNQ